MSEEKEIKLNLLSEKNYLTLREALPESIEDKELENVFFDTEDWELSRSGWALRVRRQAEKALVTLKGLSRKDVSGLTVRPEYEAEIPLETARRFIQNDLMKSELPDSIKRQLDKFGDSEKIANKFAFMTRRTVFPYSDGDFNLKFEMDITTFPDGSKDYELEIELEDRKTFNTVIKSIKELFGKLNISFIYQDESKFKRALNKINRDFKYE